MSVLCLVPSALRASRAARRLCDAGDGILLDTRVSTLDAFAAAVLAATAARPVLPPLGERILVAEVASAAPRFAGADPDGGVVRSVAAAIAELRQAEVGASDLRAAAAEAGGRAAERLSSLAAVLDAYERRLDDRGLLDGAAATRAAAEAVSRCPDAEPLRDLDLVVVDAAGSLSPAALDLVLALARRARRTQLRVPYFAARADLCAAIEPLVRRVEALDHRGDEHRVDLVLEEVTDGSTRAELLAGVLRGVFGAEAPTRDTTHAERGLVMGCAGPGQEGEAEVAAGMIAALLERGFAPEDVVVVAPSMRAAERLGPAAAAFGIPFAGAPSAPLADEAPVRTVRDALGAAIRPSRSAVEQLLCSPYLALGRSPTRLGFWLDRAGAADERGDPVEALRRRAATLTAPGAAAERAALGRAADALESAAAELRPLAGPGTARDHAARMRAFVGRSGIRRRAARGDPALAQRDLASLQRFADTSEALVRAVGLLGGGGEVLEASRWEALLAVATGSAAAPPLAETARGVELWPAAEAPGLSARAAVLVGCGGGSFPAPAPAEALLGDAERAAIHRVLRRPVLATSSSRAAEARHAAFCALAVAREALCLTWPGPGPEGAGPGPAPLAVEVLALAGVDPGAPPGYVPARRSVAQVLRAAVRDGGAGGCVVELPPELRERAGSALARGRIEAERSAAVRARSATRHAGAIPAALADALHAALPAEWTPSQLEDHARCPFRFLARTVLGVEDPETGDIDVDPRDEGSLTHAILERFYRRCIASGAVPLRGLPEERQLLRVVAAEVFARFAADGRTGDPAVWEGRRGTVLRRLERVVAAEAASADGTVPVLLEHRFGGAGGAPPLEFPDGDTVVRVRGRVDRVDASADRLVVVDYKDTRAAGAWRKKLARDALGETNFQIPAYVMAAARALPGRQAVEATYLLLRSAERLPPFAADAGDALFALDAQARAAARDGGERPFADAVVSAVRRIRSGVFPIASRDCAGCPFGAVCRFESRAEEEP